MKEQASTATTTTHPLFMTPFTPKELKNEREKLLPDKSPSPSGITNRMLQAGDTDFQGHILILFNGLWEFHTQPSDWQLSLLQCIYKGHNKGKTDPASYRGIYLNDTLAKLFEGLLIARLTTHTVTELFNTLTSNQLGTKPETQTHDAIYSLFAIIQHNKYTLEQPTPLHTPPFIVTARASPLLYSRMTSEATCGTISGLALTNLSSKFITLAFPHTTQSTSSEDYPKGTFLVQFYSEYLLLILYKNSQPNSP